VVELVLGFLAVGDGVELVEAEEEEVEAASGVAEMAEESTRVASTKSASSWL